MQLKMSMQYWKKKNTTGIVSHNHFQIRAQLQMQHTEQKAENKFSGT